MRALEHYQMRKDSTGLFEAIEAVLKAAPGPMDAVTLHDTPEIKKLALSANRVSDYLGILWRRGAVARTPAVKTDDRRTRWAYEWKGQRGPKIYDRALEYTPTVLADRPSVLITEEGSVITLEFPNLYIVIKQKTPTK